jgi:hypothetical protein
MYAFHGSVPRAVQSTTEHTNTRTHLGNPPFHPSAQDALDGNPIIEARKTVAVGTAA